VPVGIVRQRTTQFLFAQLRSGQQRAGTGRTDCVEGGAAFERQHQPRCCYIIVISRGYASVELAPIAQQFDMRGGLCRRQRRDFDHRIGHVVLACSRPTLSEPPLRFKSAETGPRLALMGAPL
jgi:hypothetical protein